MNVEFIDNQWNYCMLGLGKNGETRVRIPFPDWIGVESKEEQI